jgi:hypothetical protein
MCHFDWYMINFIKQRTYSNSPWKLIYADILVNVIIVQYETP